MAEGVAEDSIASIAREVADDAMRLVRAEIALAKAEMRSAALRLAFGIGLLSASMVLLLIAVIDALGALPEGVGPRLLGSSWLAWLALGGVLLIVAVLIGLAGALRLRKALGQGRDAVNIIKEDAEWVRRLTGRSKSGS